VIRNFTDLPPASEATPGRTGVYIGRLSSEKGLDVLLRALRLAADPPFTVIGDGPERSKLQSHAAHLGLKRIRFAGRVPAREIRPMLERARFVAFPSRWHENAPLAAIEAMVAGRPLLVTARGGLPELADGGRGLVCSPDDVQEMAVVIRRLMTDDELCRRAGEASLAFARSELAPAAHRTQLEVAYETVLAATKNRVRIHGGERT
jgi:glycosyltransferase involved in cell wall biosynthesis